MSWRLALNGAAHKMSGSGNRYVVTPTVTVLTMMKARLVGATKGHALLKKKADALTMRFRQILKQIIETKEGLGDTMKGSFFSWAEAKYSAGENIKHTILDNVETALVKVQMSQDNVAGVKIPKFVHFVEPGESKNDLTGMLGIWAALTHRTGINARSTQQNVTIKDI